MTSFLKWVNGVKEKTKFNYIHIVIFFWNKSQGLSNYFEIIDEFDLGALKFCWELSWMLKFDSSLWRLNKREIKTWLKLEFCQICMDLLTGQFTVINCLNYQTFSNTRSTMSRPWRLDDYYSMLLRKFEKCWNRDAVYGSPLTLAPLFLMHLSRADQKISMC
jgi:hypothetical protein